MKTNGSDVTMDNWRTKTMEIFQPLGNVQDLSVRSEILVIGSQRKLSTNQRCLNNFRIGLQIFAQVSVRHPLRDQMDVRAEATYSGKWQNVGMSQISI